MKNILTIENLHASVHDKEIIKGLNLTINSGEVHVIMGPNGAGKSTLSSCILSNKQYVKTAGRITFCGEDITHATTDVIARKGIFLSHQLPEEIEGISVFNFLKTAKSKIDGKNVYSTDFRKELMPIMSSLDMSESVLDRDLNVSFSGGEKKKCEILQLMALRPTLAILDEADSGLDTDAVKAVSKGIEMFRGEGNALLIITHSMKLLQHIPATHVHVFIDGKIVKSGDSSLAEQIDMRGYEGYKGENG